MPERLAPVLLVEDSPEDFEATRRALQRAGLPNPLAHCATGDEALAYLFARKNAGGEAAKAKPPALILLDLNLPGTDGRQVLAEVKKDETLRQIPVVVLTTSSDERDVAACYLAGANSYIQKPVDLKAFRLAVASLRTYWFDTVLLPSVG